MKRLHVLLQSISVVMLLLLTAIGIFEYVHADTDTDGVTINATVPTTLTSIECNDGLDNDGDGDIDFPADTDCTDVLDDSEAGGGGGPPPPPPPPPPPGDTSAPLVTGVSAVPSSDGAVVSWTAIDDVGVGTCSFIYGVSPGLTTPLAPSRSGDTFQVVLSGLGEGTSYSFSISCNDAAGNTGSGGGEFNTLDLTPPEITGINTIAQETSAVTTWTATDTGGGIICTYAYDTDGAPFDFSGSVNDSGGGSFDVNPTGLTPSTNYIFEIGCSDAAGNSTIQGGSFVSLGDSVPPPGVNNFQASGENQQINLSWDYSSSLSDFDFYMIRRGTSVPSSPSDGTGVATISNINQKGFGDASVINGVQYFYTIFVFDTSGNVSGGASASAIPQATSEAGQCSDGVDNDLDGLIDCLDNDCSGDASCGGVEICDNGIDDNANSLVDCAESSCSLHPSCVTPGVEICTDGIDNDFDGFIDCSDSQCSSNSSCLFGAACSDGLDNDGDGHIDLLDPGCSSSFDNSELDISTFIGDADKLKLETVLFWVAERTISTAPVSGELRMLMDDQVTVGINRDDLASLGITSIMLGLGSNSYAFFLDGGVDMYQVDFISPATGNYTATINVQYAGGIIDQLEFSAMSLPFSVVKDSNSDEFLSGATVKLSNIDTGEIWRSDIYRQVNPQTTSGNGAFGYVVPNGRYQLLVSKDGYRDRETPVFTISDHIVVRNIDLIERPPELIDVIDPNAGLGENIVNIAENLTEKAQEQVQIIGESISDAAEQFQEFADDEQVEQVTKTIVAPAVVTLAAAAIIPSIWSIILPLLQFLFLQPILLLGKKKRENWGVVYNSLTKLPVDLAIIRLVDLQTKRVKQSRVTDRQGRYLFIAEPGNYIIEAHKNGFNYPTQVLAQVNEDGRMVDIYHGEDLVVTESDTVLTPNIPLDPVGAEEKPRKIIFTKYKHFVQELVSLTGIFATGVAFYITPVWYIGIFLVIHILLYIGFKKYVKVKKPKGWGIVSDKHSSKPLGKVVARLFSKEYNKLIATQVTDGKGRYAFLVGPTDYYVTYERAKYKTLQTETIPAQVVEKSGIIKQKISMERA